MTPRQMEQSTLSQDWAFRPALDVELKHYILLGYLQRVEARFAERKLYPHLHEVRTHLDELLRVKRSKSDLARAFLDCVARELDDSPGPVGYLPGSDAKHLVGLTRGEMVIFGPGSYEVAHAYDEYVELAEFEATTDSLKGFVERTLVE